MRMAVKVTGPTTDINGKPYEVKRGTSLWPEVSNEPGRTQQWRYRSAEVVPKQN
jgi:hypothetical protein